jgi:hypothetical protein
VREPMAHTNKPLRTSRGSRTKEYTKGTMHFHLSVEAVLPLKD